MTDDTKEGNEAKPKGSKMRELETQDWYHGYRPSRDVNPLLKEVGDFLVRATDAGNKPLIVISVRCASERVIHLTLTYKATKWQLGVLNHKKPPSFNAIVDLVDHYKTHKAPGKICLKKPISRPKWHIKHSKIDFDKKKDLLGSGNFCHVYKGIYTKTEEEKLVVAVKIWHAGKESDKNADESNDARDSMLSEAQLMSYYAHKHVIQFFGVACDHPPVMIVMEFCPGGNLEKHLRTLAEKIDVSERLLYALEAARGMRFLHSKNCVHRDLAARNCLISDTGRIKISDFGLSQLIGDEKEKPKPPTEDKEDKEHKSGGKGGPQIPVRWMAPESLRRPMQFSTKSDVWSYGVLCYEVFNKGEKPWPEDPVKKIATNIRKGRMPTLPERTPAEMQELIKIIWMLEPEKRPDMKKIVQKVHDMTRIYRVPTGLVMAVNHIPGVTRDSATLDDTMEAEQEDIHDVYKVESLTTEGKTDQKNDGKNDATRDKELANMVLDARALQEKESKMKTEQDHKEKAPKESKEKDLREKKSKKEKPERTVEEKDKNNKEKKRDKQERTVDEKDVKDKKKDKQEKTIEEKDVKDKESKEKRKDKQERTVEEKDVKDKKKDKQEKTVEDKALKDKTPHTSKEPGFSKEVVVEPMEVKDNKEKEKPKEALNNSKEQISKENNKKLLAAAASKKKAVDRPAKKN